MGRDPTQHRSARSFSLPTKTAKPPELQGEMRCASALTNAFARFSDILRENSLTEDRIPRRATSHIYAYQALQLYNIFYLLSRKNKVKLSFYQVISKTPRAYHEVCGGVFLCENVFKFWGVGEMKSPLRHVLREPPKLDSARFGEPLPYKA